MASKELSILISQEVSRQTDVIIDDVDSIFSGEADEVIADLKELSPKKTGEYSKSWYKEKHVNAKGTSYLIRNKKGKLTHILENGRMIKGKLKGRRPHIDICKKRSDKRLQKKLGGK